MPVAPFDIPQRRCCPGDVRDIRFLVSSWQVEMGIGGCKCYIRRDNLGEPPIMPTIPILECFTDRVSGGRECIRLFSRRDRAGYTGGGSAPLQVTHRTGGGRRGRRAFFTLVVLQ